MLLENLVYDPETGIFRWAKSRGNRRAGQQAGNLMINGYRSIRIGGVLYYEHRLAWLATSGALPVGEIDHINGSPKDNRIDNLRLASRSENAANSRRHRDKKVGSKGTIYDARRDTWEARIKIAGKTIWLGTFPTDAAAHAVYCKAARTWFGAFCNFGTSPIKGEKL